MVNLQEEPTESLFELVKREAWWATLVPGVAVQIAKKHLVNGPKEALYAPASLWLTRNRKPVGS
jgi:hypothetical protein